MLDVKRFSLACGIVCGSGMALLAIFAAMYGVGGALVVILATLVGGYGASAVGVGIGFIWGFVDGIIAGALFAWLYNNLNLS